MKHSVDSASSSSSPPRSSSIAAASVTDGKRPIRPKEAQFIYKHGQKLTSTPKAPYPLSYNREVLELEYLEGQLVKYLREGSVSLIDFTEKPARSLDLGCGTGAWIIEAAKEWPSTHFVGFDLVNVQLPLKHLDPSLEERISFVYGNFLTTKLPFEDDEFDHVHVKSIALGVPENKWGVLFEEICRVLRPGGSIEMIEDDVVFPVLPRWFTAPMRARPRRADSVHLPEGSSRGSIPSTQETSTPHDHALLESLYKSVFEHRFVNMKPSAVLPSYFTTYFRHVTLGPVLSFLMPPIPPLQPLPPQMATAYVGPMLLDADQRSSVLPPFPSPVPNRPVSLSFSSVISKELSSDSSQISREKSHSISSVQGSDALSSVAISDTDSESENITCPLPRDVYKLDAGGLEASQVYIISPERLKSLNERSLAMQLYRAYTIVLGCQEALWEELKDRIRNRRDELEPFGWEDEEEFEELQNRQKFERLLERYRSDMQARISLWCSLQDIGWALPPREPLTKAELIEEERIREAMLEARRHATFEDLQLPCRSVRSLIGLNP